MGEKIISTYYSALYGIVDDPKYKLRFNGYYTGDWIYYLQEEDRFVQILDYVTMGEIVKLPLSSSIFNNTEYEFELKHWDERDKRIIEHYLDTGIEDFYKKDYV